MREWWALLEERASHNETPMRPQTVAWHLPELMANDAILCGDSGTVTVWQARMKLRDRQRFSFSGTMCSMAAALPYAIGAQTAYPNRQVVAFTGDGSLRQARLTTFSTCSGAIRHGSQRRGRKPFPP